MGYKEDKMVVFGAVAKAVGLLAILAVGSIHHMLGTRKEIVKDALVTGKEITSHYERKGRHTVLEYDHYINTDKGQFRDEDSWWDLKLSDGELYEKIQEQKVYDFVVNVNTATGYRNIMDASLDGQPLGELYTLSKDAQEQRRTQLENKGAPMIYPVRPA